MDNYKRVMSEIAADDEKRSLMRERAKKRKVDSKFAAKGFSGKGAVLDKMIDDYLDGLEDKESGLEDKERG